MTDPRPEKRPPRRGVLIPAAEGTHRRASWKGGVSAAALDTEAFVLSANWGPGEGPSLHVHPYDEIFVIQEGHARFTIGDDVFDATEGDVLMGPANVPHKFHNAGDGPLRSIDIHLNAEWIQTDLPDPQR